MDYTTIQINKTTRKSLNSLKLYPRQTYDELLIELMSLIPESAERHRKYIYKKK